jgi:hypothetical protein
MYKRIFYLLFHIGFLAILVLDYHHPFLTPVAAAYSAAFTVVIVKYGALDKLPRSNLPDNTTSLTMWRVAVTMVAICFGLPAALVMLATSGGSLNATFGFTSNSGLGWRVYLDIPEALCLLGIVALVVVLPEQLRTEDGPPAANSPVPGWLAGFASVLTVAFAFILHYDAKSGLLKAPLGALTVAAFLVAALLAPFYRFLAQQCRQLGIVVVFDPVQWWSAWRVAYAEITKVTTTDVGDDAQKAAANGAGIPHDGLEQPGTRAEQEIQAGSRSDGPEVRSLRGSAPP